MTIGNRIKELRQQRQITQRELADEVQYSFSYIGDLERGRTQPSIKALEAIAGFFEVDVSYLLGAECCYKRLHQGKSNIYGCEIEECLICPLMKHFRTMNRKGD